MPYSTWLAYGVNIIREKPLCQLQEPIQDRMQLYSIVYHTVVQDAETKETKKKKEHERIGKR